MPTTDTPTAVDKPVSWGGLLPSAVALLPLFLGFVFRESVSSGESEGAAGVAVAAGLFLVGLALAAGCRVWLGRGIAKPLARVSEGVRRRAQARGRDLGEPTGDDTLWLEGVFDRILTELGEREAALQVAREDLQRNIVERALAVDQGRREAAIEQQRFKFIFEATPVGISMYSWVAGGGSASFLINDAHLRICGITREEVEKDEGIFSRISHPEDQAKQSELLRRLEQREIRAFTMEKRYLRPDGRTAWVSFSTMRNEYPDGRAEALSTVVDITDLKNAQEETAREQARLKFIFDSVPVGISLYSGFGDDLRRSFLINDAHLDICGVTREQALTDHTLFGRLTHPDDYARQIPLNAQIASREIQRFTIKKRYIRPDGRIVWVSFAAQRNDYPDGRVETLGTVIDITDLKNAQEEASREQARFRFIFDSLPVGVSWRLLGKGTRLLVNPAHQRITGISSGEALEAGVFARVSHPDDYARQQVLVQKFMAGEIDHFTLEKRYLHPDGSVFWVVMMSRMSVDSESGERQAVTTLVDVTDLKMAQEETARERTRFKFIFDSLPVGVAWMLKGRRATRVVNPSFCRITGVPMESSQEIERFWEATHPDDRPVQRALYQRLVKGELDHFNYEKRYVHPNGETRWSSFSLHLLQDATTNEVQELTTLVDVTDRKRADDELRAIHRQLLETSRQAGMAEVATGVLHNVGNVLNSVNVSCTLVAEQVRRSKAPNVGKLRDLVNQHRDDLARFLIEDPKGRAIPSYLGTLAEAIAAEQKTMLVELDDLQRNVTHIKDIVAMQQNYAKTSGVVETISLPDLVEDALRMNAGSLARHDVSVARDYDARPVITVEKNKVLQILVNLIRNAKYACDESGRVEKIITLRTQADSACVMISVADNGVGIVPENITRIFAHGFSTRKHGHGFGLHSGALAARELGGTLSAQSEGPGRGAVFTLKLPFRHDSAPAPTAPT